MAGLIPGIRPMLPPLPDPSSGYSMAVDAISPMATMGLNLGGMPFGGHLGGFDAEDDVSDTEEPEEEEEAEEAAEEALDGEAAAAEGAAIAADAAAGSAAHVNGGAPHANGGVPEANGGSLGRGGKGAKGVFSAAPIPLVKLVTAEQDSKPALEVARILREEKQCVPVVGRENGAWSLRCCPPAGVRHRRVPVLAAPPLTTARPAPHCVLPHRKQATQSAALAALYAGLGSLSSLQLQSLAPPLPVQQEEPASHGASEEGPAEPSGMEEGDEPGSGAQQQLLQIAGPGSGDVGQDAAAAAGADAAAAAVMAMAAAAAEAMAAEVAAIKQEQQLDDGAAAALAGLGEQGMRDAEAEAFGRQVEAHQQQEQQHEQPSGDQQEQQQEREQEGGRHDEAAAASGGEADGTPRGTKRARSEQTPPHALGLGGGGAAGGAAGQLPPMTPSLMGALMNMAGGLPGMAMAPMLPGMPPLGFAGMMPPMGPGMLPPEAMMAMALGAAAEDDESDLYHGSSGGSHSRLVDMAGADDGYK
jgi:hypothetical protein